jgi:hypothetical protein
MIELEFCRRTDPRYVEMRDRHYIPNKGNHGQQLHFLIYRDGVHVGIISGGSCVWWVAGRDKFFGIPSDKEKRASLYLSSIVNNTVFRLEVSEPNLGTRILALWRRTMQQLWPEIYGVPIIGYETFIIEAKNHRDGDRQDRVGSMYKADNWTFVGETAGKTKTHSKAMGNTGLTGGALWTVAEPKLVYCRWAKKPVVPTTPYVSSWHKQTPEEKKLDRERTKLRATLEGARFA